MRIAQFQTRRGIYRIDSFRLCRILPCQGVDSTCADKLGYLVQIFGPYVRRGVVRGHSRLAFRQVEVTVFAARRGDSSARLVLNERI